VLLTVIGVLSTFVGLMLHAMSNVIHEMRDSIKGI
jgi:hypothetical protein